MLLNSQILDTFDRCSRRLALERTHEPLTISPIGLLYAGVGGGIIAPEPCIGAIDAVREMTGKYGIDSPNLAPISVVRHIGFMAEVISLALTRKYGQMRRLPESDFGEHRWQSNLFETRKGLHRIVFVSYLDDDSLRGFAHSWGTIGELAALRQSINLTAVVIGSNRGGRRHSHWAKCYQHPIQKSALRFGRRKKDDGFTAAWKEIWREQTTITAATWLEKMQNDDVVGDLIQSREIPYRDKDIRIAKAQSDMLAIIPQIEKASPDDPMRRSSCDEIGRGACPWQSLCYSPQEIEADDLSYLYRRR